VIADARLALPAVSGAVVVGILIGFPELLNSVAIGGWVSVAVVISAALLVPRWKGALATAAVTATVTAALLTSAALHTTARSPSLLVDAAQAGRFVTVTAVLDAEVESKEPSSRTPMTITDVTVGRSTMNNLAIPAIVFGTVPTDGIGARISVAGTIAPTTAGDRAAYLIFARGSARTLESPPWFLDWSNELRAQFRSASAELPGDGGALLPGLAIGDTRAVSHALDDAMKATALSHLTAVSGANCAVVVGLIMLLGAAFGTSRAIRIAVSLVVLAGFVVLVTPDASVLRAAVMAALVLFALASGRPSRGLPVLSLAVIVLLTIDPWLSRDYGFILSVLATAGLLVLAGPLARVLSRWLPTPLAVLISIPLAAQLACQPVLILLNPAVPVYGVIANLLAEPAAPVATVLGLLGCVSLGVVPAVGHTVLAIAWLPSAWIAAIARFFAAAPGAQAPWIPGGVGAAVIAMFTALVLLALFGRRSRATTTISGVLLLSVVCYGGVLVGAELGRAGSLPPSWQIAACDIGQGDAVLVRSRGQVALIDTGPQPEALSECLDHLGVERIQLLILSHYDLDHVGGTSAVLGRVDHALVGPVSDDGDVGLRTSLQAAGASVSEVSRGAHGTLGDLSWEVLWPPTRLGTVETGNAASVTVRFDEAGQCQDGCLSALFLGDLGEQPQSRLLGTVHPAPVDVVKVAHHGSADQSQRLYEQLRARVGIISAGLNNTYGHPTDRLLHILSSVGTGITRTDLEGMILVSPTTDGGLMVWTEHSPDRDVGTH
jgi:competence protein ComEC